MRDRREAPAAGRWPPQPPARLLAAPAERGAATVLVLGLVAALLAVTVGGLVLASVVVASHRARLAADLAALAAAVPLRDGVAVGDACAAARRVAASNGAGLIDCAADGLMVDVTVVVTATAWPEPARARARAGPAAPVAPPGQAVVGPG